MLVNLLLCPLVISGFAMTHFGRDIRYGFVNGKVWVGSDNQAHDAPSHNCTTIGIC